MFLSPAPEALLAGALHIAMLDRTNAGIAHGRVKGHKEDANTQAQTLIAKLSTLRR